ncbi:hypothetical protein RND81_03G219000 [Saponaria officinalis]|uniref:Late embryogenesis abundant protein LEA-2 subgroup domain-containing protein n=1 Tax=Saponaria officinalis TaxID=3572 RepID=A0AAW1M8A7_SAPOF
MADGQPLKKPPGYMDPATPAMRTPPPGQRKPVVPPVFYQTNKKKRNCCRICCCCVCCLVVFIIIICAISCALFYIWFQPKIPSFHFRELELDRFSITPNKRDGTALLDSKAIIRVEAKNPNTKLKIHYGVTEVSLNLDEEVDLGSTTLPGFVQPPNNMTLLKFNVGVENEVIDSSSGTRLSTRVKNENTEVNAAVKTKVGVGIWKTKIGMLPVNVNCGGITLKQLNDGSGSPKCSFNTLRWITIH